jgi:hypothetical protein
MDTNMAMNAADAALTVTDDQIKADLADTNYSLSAEIARGQGRDVSLEGHRVRLVAAEDDLVDKQYQLNNLTEIVEDNRIEAEQKLAAAKAELETSISDLESELKAADNVLRLADVALGQRIDATNLALNVEKTRNDLQDDELDLHTSILNDHDNRLIAQDGYIKTVQSNLDNAVVAIGETIDETEAELQASINSLNLEMLAADKVLTAETERLQGEITETNIGLANEVTRGLGRDTKLNEHNVRLTVLRKDSDDNSAAIAATNNKLNLDVYRLDDSIKETNDKLSARITETDRIVL